MKAARARGVDVTALVGTKSPGLQLGFAAVRPTEIRRGVRELAIALEAARRNTSLSRGRKSLTAVALLAVQGPSTAFGCRLTSLRMTNLNLAPQRARRKTQIYRQARREHREIFSFIVSLCGLGVFGG